MSRQKLYDEEEARQQMVMLFHRQSFADTSLADLEAGTGLNRRQLYNNFGDKLQMFLGALDDFTRQSVKLFLSPLKNGTRGIEDIRQALEMMTAMAGTKAGKNGCLLCNTSREPIMENKSVALRVERFFDSIEQSYESALWRAQALGELGSNTNPSSLATFFLGVHVSLCVLGRAGRSQHALEEIAKGALFTLNINKS